MCMHASVCVCACMPLCVCVHVCVCEKDREMIVQLKSLKVLL